MGPTDLEKQHHEQIEDVHDPANLQDDTVVNRGFASAYFLGSFFAVGFNLAASTAGFALIAPVLGNISVALGPSESIIWLSLVYTLGLAVGLTLVGRLSDIFGRRWFFIGGTILGLVGAIIASTANMIPVLIRGQILIGLSASTGYSYAFIIGELVPVKWRFIANAIIFLFSLPTAGFGAAISTSLILHTGPGRYPCYYLLIILNGVTAVFYAIFYFPPTFHQKHGRDTFILGLSSCGSLYLWKSAYTIAFIVTSVDPKEPLIPMHLFRNKGYVAARLSLSLGASVYYSQTITRPQMTANVYGNGREKWVGLPTLGIGITVGEIVGGGIAKNVGKWKWQCIAVITLGTILLGLTAICSHDTPKAAMAIVFIATTFVGRNEFLVLPICTIAIRDQQEIGTAAGMAGSSQSAISTVASTIYSVVLTARMGKTIPAQVPKAVIAAGLLASSVADYMTAITAGGSEKALQAVKGLTPQILIIGTKACRHAYMDAYRTIFLVSIAFGSLAILVSFFIPDINNLMNDSVVATLHGRKYVKMAGEKYRTKRVNT
ncbi:MFS general substrate transporter [Glonium stellatum]|uniref:MFS general substrate transporter n=1 Tax=Glonium stellatum TaxID=574774 RepID=A0A8E2JT28_9PEZI|nr:MFS general substrate transporter [Glonium stellatum]